MKTILGTTALFVMLTVSGTAFAQDKSSCPEVTKNMNIDQLPEKWRAELDTWSMSQPDTSVDVEGDFAVGAILPETVKFTAVPINRNYGYVVVNGKRMLVNLETRAVMKIY